ncbi:FAD binding domain-containing protein [Colletotrichum musicola]|uniref:FAD binding domain-containing protein n=1 Tax=Colletotrichum musicola TaxID=2175873 RepID=A0A8H6K381_9PEZI|nr:FAD binding domain-containing protein [Colletotrichum musicola]
MRKNGGNALGLSPEAGPLVHIQVDTHWDAAELDEVVESSAADLVAKITRLAEERGLAAGYVYLNYADKNQDVYAGYGEERHARLREVAGKYDPDGSFRDLWRGYFEL